MEQEELGEICTERAERDRGGGQWRGNRECGRGISERERLMEGKE